MKSVVAHLCAGYEAIRLAAIYFTAYLLFPREFATGLGPLLLAGILPSFALIALVAAAGLYGELRRPTAIAFRIYKALTIPVWAYLLLTLLAGGVVERTTLLALAALGLFDVTCLLLSFLVSPETENRGDQRDSKSGDIDHPKREEIEVD